MEGYIYFYQGLFSGYKLAYALIECCDFAIYKRDIYEGQLVRLSLNCSMGGGQFVKGETDYTKEDQGWMLSSVAIETVQDSLDFEILCTVEKKPGKFEVEKLKLRAEDAKSKQEWIKHIGRVTTNLADEVLSCKASDTQSNGMNISTGPEAPVSTNMLD